MEMSCLIKASVVEKDEKEKSLRQILNFGHTLGHAIEKSSRFSIPHGYSVAMGMIIESHISFMRNLLSAAELEAIVNLIKSYGLDRYISMIKGISPGRICESSLTDKKNIKMEIKAVMLKKIGEVYEEEGAFSFSIGREEIGSGLNYLFKL